MCWTPEQRHGGYTDLTMLPWLLFVGLILLNVAPTLEGHLHYAVILPSEIHGPGSQLACFHFNGAKGQTSIQLNLTTSAGIETLIEKTFEDESVFSCLPFQVSKPTTNEDVATMEVSIKTPTETIVNQTKVFLLKQRFGTLIQTDKPVYKPGQTVKFRILTLKENLQPMHKQIAFVELQDPEKNRIGQWLNVKPSHGISEFSFALSPEPILGEYTIRVEDTAHTFSVEEYVLPKFEVSMKLPPVVLVNSESFEVKVCGRYTYGKPVQGVYHGSVCRKEQHFLWFWGNRNSSQKDLCQNITGQLPRSGCATVTMKSDHYQLTRSNFEMTLNGKASVIEDGTGIEFSTSGSILLSKELERLSFMDAVSNYRPGFPYRGTLKLEDNNGQPIPNKPIHLRFTSYNNEEAVTTTDNNGVATFVQNTATWIGYVDILARTDLEDHPYHLDFMRPQYGYARLSLLPFYSTSKSFLKLQSDSKNLPCEGQHEVRVEYIINHNELKPDTKKLHLHYLIVTRASVRDSGTTEILLNKAGQDLTGSTSFNFPLTPDVSPNLRVLVYILLPGGEIVADLAKFTVQRCFKNKVSVQFSPGDVLPGSDVSLQIQAGARSLCGLRVVDQSVVLMKPEKELTDDQVHSLFPYHDYGWYDYRIEDPEYDCFPDLFGSPVSPQATFGRSARSIYVPGVNTADVLTYFKEMRLKIITNTNIKKPVDCTSRPEDDRWGQGYAVPGLGFSGGDPVLGAAPVPVMEIANRENTIAQEIKAEEKVRKYFPETWLFQLTPVGDSGSVVLHESAPDTITDWNAGAFCMGPSGFGLSSPASLRVFQPFFVDLTLPYSVVRGESFTLKASVFNYLKECIKVKVTLGPSEELAEELCANCPRTSCLCVDESKTFYWNLKAMKLGEVNITVRTEAVDTEELCHNELPIVPKQGSIDTVIKPLLVQPEGILEEKSHSSLLCIQKDQAESAEEEISLKVPENIVKDSVRAHMTVLGDLMGTAMQNVDRLLAMPYGCGEQNMVLFAPNIFILQYLEETHQLNEAILAKAKTFLEGGYQRQLTYKHHDGSYSAFGKSDPEGNTWLTAFVVKSFSKARPYIFIDETHLNQSFAWLKNHRSVSGCFESVGRLFNNAMKGGVEDEISLSAYVTTSLLESGLSKEDPLVADALSCLRNAAVDVSNVYTQALLAYTFTLAEDTETRQILLEKLEKQAVRKDGQLHWERPSAKPTSDLPYWYQAPSAEVELTAYMLMTGLSGPEKDLGRASEIVNWLSKQQNPYGGFSSTQDTVVALQSLGQYAGATFSDAGDVTVTVRSQTGVQEFHVDNTNRLLVQKASLPDIPGDYTLTAAGSGCVYVQTVLRYNVPPPRSDATFVIRVEVKPDQCPEEAVKTLQLQITAQYTGSREKSNMALIEVKMLSGFIPVKSSVKELEKSRRIQRGDVQTDMVTLYLDEVGGGFTQLVFEVEQDFDVKNLKPAAVKIYDYYETGEHAVTEYNSPCSSEENRTN